MQRVNNKHIPINLINTHSSYQSTMARFHNILNNKLNVKPQTMLTSLNSVNSQAVTKIISTNGLTAQKIATKSADGIDLIASTPRGSISLNPDTNVTLSSGNSVTRINDALANSPIQGLGQAFKDAEQKTGVNAYVLAGMAIHESNYGKSSIAQNKHNLFGFMAYDDNPYANAKSYDTFEDSINDVAEYLSQNYLKTDGKYYEGTGIADIGKNYASDPMWAEKVTGHVERLLK